MSTRSLASLALILSLATSLSAVAGNTSPPQKFRLPARISRNQQLFRLACGGAILAGIAGFSYYSYRVQHAPIGARDVQKLENEILPTYRNDLQHFSPEENEAIRYTQALDILFERISRASSSSPYFEPKEKNNLSLYLLTAEDVGSKLKALGPKLANAPHLEALQTLIEDEISRMKEGPELTTSAGFAELVSFYLQISEMHGKNSSAYVNDETVRILTYILTLVPYEKPDSPSARMKEEIADWISNRIQILTKPQLEYLYQGFFPSVNTGADVNAAASSSFQAKISALKLAIQQREPHAKIEWHERGVRLQDIARP